MSENYLSLEKLETYQLGCALGETAWDIFNTLTYEQKKLSVRLTLNGLIKSTMNQKSLVT